MGPGTPPKGVIAQQAPLGAKGGVSAVSTVEVVNYGIVQSRQYNRV